MGRIGQKKPETNIFKCLWYKVQLFGVTLINRAIFNLKNYSIVFYNAPSVIRSTSIKSNEIYDF